MKKWFFFLCLWGCSPASMQDVRWEAEAETRKLAWELKRVETKEQLQEALPRIKKRYNKIAVLLLETRHLQGQEDLHISSVESSVASEELFMELARLYEIPGARDLIELAQNEAIRKLDSSRRSL